MNLSMVKPMSGSTVNSMQNKLAFSVAEASEQTTLSKSHLRNEIRDGNLKVRRINRRVIILRDDLLNYLTKGDEK